MKKNFLTLALICACVLSTVTASLAGDGIILIGGRTTTTPTPTPTPEPGGGIILIGGRSGEAATAAPSDGYFSISDFLAYFGL